jgi:hypothetical protein
MNAFDSLFGEGCADLLTNMPRRATSEQVMREAFARKLPPTFSVSAAWAEFQRLANAPAAPVSRQLTETEMISLFESRR